MKLAERFHCLPQDIRNMPEADYRGCLLFMGVEAEADRLKSQQAAHYRK
jgi:hypothetical protein